MYCVQLNPRRPIRDLASTWLPACVPHRFIDRSSSALLTQASYWKHAPHANNPFSYNRRFSPWCDSDFPGSKKDGWGVIKSNRNPTLQIKIINSLQYWFWWPGIIVGCIIILIYFCLAHQGSSHNVCPIYLLPLPAGEWNARTGHLAVAGYVHSG